MQRFISVLLAAAAVMNISFAVNAEKYSVDDIAVQMTTEQKIAQMIMPSVRYYADEYGTRQNMTELTKDAANVIGVTELGSAAGSVVIVQKGDMCYVKY